MSYEAEFTKDQILLAILKLSANNNAMLQILLENMLEVRKTLVRIETIIDDGTFKKEMEIELEEYISMIREQINDIKAGVENKSLREAYEWAFVNDSDSMDLGDLGLKE